MQENASIGEPYLSNANAFASNKGPNLTETDVCSANNVNPIQMNVIGNRLQTNDGASVPPTRSGLPSGVAVSSSLTASNGTNTNRSLVDPTFSGKYGYVQLVILVLITYVELS